MEILSPLPRRKPQTLRATYGRSSASPPASKLSTLETKQLRMAHNRNGKGRKKSASPIQTATNDRAGGSGGCCFRRPEPPPRRVVEDPKDTTKALFNDTEEAKNAMDVIG